MGGGVRGKSELASFSILWLLVLIADNVYSLALVEMKMLLREVYSRYRTTVASDMTASMKLDDQIISSRPKGQSCKLDFADRK